MNFNGFIRNVGNEAVDTTSLVAELNQHIGWNDRLVGDTYNEVGVGIYSYKQRGEVQGNNLIINQLLDSVNPVLANNQTIPHCVVMKLDEGQSFGPVRYGSALSDTNKCLLFIGSTEDVLIRCGNYQEVPNNNFWHEHNTGERLFIVNNSNSTVYVVAIDVVTVL